jgi:hypothetical protein
VRRGLGLLAAMTSSLLALAACAEKPQTVDSKRKTDVQAFEGAASAFTASGWKVGDEASWEQQMKTRAQSQNEYSRTAP